MKILEVFEIIQKRLTKKLARARQAFLKENTIKKTQNCLNKGRNLAGELYHCRINAMGEHEHGASQCWSEKACICPLFELKYGVEKLEHQFQSMSVEELSIRWPSIGELIRIQDLLSQAEEIKAHGKDPSRSVCTDQPVCFPDSPTTEAGGSEPSVPPIDQHGSGGGTTAAGGVPESGGRDDARGSGLGQAGRERMPMVSLAKPRDGSSADRKAV